MEGARKRRDSSSTAISMSRRSETQGKKTKKKIREKKSHFGFSCGNEESPSSAKVSSVELLYVIFMLQPLQAVIMKFA